ncbi:MAG: hypothetical protein WAN51_01210 [Alphaproteobacteria bacterium]
MAIYVAHPTRYPLSGFLSHGSIFDPVNVVGATGISGPLATLIEEQAETWFRSWATQWVRETGHLSSISSRCEHAAFKQIVGLGSLAVPLLLGELQERPDFWFPALRATTHEDPVEDHMRGKFDEMRKAWLKWARKKHIVPRDVRQAVS